MRWWDATATDLRATALLGAEQREQLPSVPVPQSARPGYRGSRPLVIGHYWLEGKQATSTPKVACLDYSGAKPSMLCAHRWQGENQLPKLL